MMNEPTEADQRDESVIPSGLYCYTPSEDQPDPQKMTIKPCPYWSRRADKPEQMSGYCSFIGRGDWEIPGGLLWDQVKECGVKMEAKDG